MPRKKLSKSREEAVICTDWFIKYLFENFSNYLYNFPDRDLQRLNYRVWGGTRWGVRLEKEDSIVDSQKNYSDLQDLVGVKLAMENQNGVLTSTYKKSRPSEWSVVCYRPDCESSGLIGRPRELLKHLRVVHREDHEFACLLCDIGFGTVNALMGHQGVVHHWMPWCSDRHFSTRVRVLGSTPVSGRMQKANAVEKIGSKLVGSRPFQDGEAGCICKNMNKLYPWAEMVRAQLAVPLVEKPICELVTKRKLSLVGIDTRFCKKPKIGD